MSDELNVKQIIDTAYKDISVTGELHKQIQNGCKTSNKKYNIHLIKAASILLIASLLIGNTNLIASIKEYIYNPLSNKFFSEGNDVYILESTINVETPDGYISILNCTINDNTIQLEVETNINSNNFDNSDVDGWDYWNQEIYIKSGNHTEKMETNVSGKGMSNNPVMIWKIDIMGEADIRNGKFDLMLPYMSIPIECKLVEAEDQLAQIIYSNEDNDIKVSASKQDDKDRTIVSLNTFSKHNTRLETQFDIDNIVALDINGLEHKAVQSDRAQNQVYFNVPSKELRSITIKSFEREIIPKSFNMKRFEDECSKAGVDSHDYIKFGLESDLLNDFWEKEDVSIQLSLPKKGEKLNVNNKVSVGEYSLTISEVYRKNDGTIELHIDKNIEGLEGDISQISWRSDKIFESHPSITESVSYILYSDEAIKEDSITIEFEEIWIQENGEWTIDF